MTIYDFAIISIIRKKAECTREVRSRRRRRKKTKRCVRKLIVLVFFQFRRRVRGRPHRHIDPSSILQTTQLLLHISTGDHQKFRANMESEYVEVEVDDAHPIQVSPSLKPSFPTPYGYNPARILDCFKRKFFRGECISPSK
jgi:hypothetical protein